MYLFLAPNSWLVYKCSCRTCQLQAIRSVDFPDSNEGWPNVRTTLWRLGQNWTNPISCLGCHRQNPQERTSQCKPQIILDKLLVGQYPSCWCPGSWGPQAISSNFFLLYLLRDAGLILGLRSANERHLYNVTPSLIGSHLESALGM